MSFLIRRYNDCFEEEINPDYGGRVVINDKEEETSQLDSDCHNSVINLDYKEGIKAVKQTYNIANNGKHCLMMINNLSGKKSSVNITSLV